MNLPRRAHSTSRAFSSPCHVVVSILIMSFMIVAGGCAGPPPAAAQCTREQIRDVLEPASSGDAQVMVYCSLTIPINYRKPITKRLIVLGSPGSGVTINCNGATIDGSAVPELSQENSRKDMILITSRITGDAASPTWSRPTDVTVKNCKIIGSVRAGRAITDDLRDSSYAPGYTTRMRRIAPTRITFDNLTITARAHTPVFIGAGVTYTKLIRSELKGEAESVAVYLEAESSRNLIEGNYIHTVTPREVLAVDASDGNEIIDNRFSALSRGGIYLYRNCGEHGVVRYTTPSYNTIVNNVFYYNKYNPGLGSEKPSVYMGSRNGNRDYCGKDSGHPAGSGASDLDYAQHNVVMQNQIYKLPVGLMIKEGRATDSPNYIEYNTTVTTPIPRLAGCYVGTGYLKDFILNGESIEISGRRYTCHDGELAV
jgi:hypothetical protein